jgi:DNA-binding response OmpR family regulator
VYGIVKQNNGHVAVRSRPGVGTTFTVYLPRARREAGDAREQAGDASAPRGNGQTVLLVEDETAILRLCKLQLEHNGYEVLAASTPEEALETCRVHDGPIHVMVTDVIMPGMNGRELSTNVAELRPGTRFVFMSGYTSDVVSKDGFPHNGFRLLQKPFSVRDLLSRVHDALMKEA